MDHSSEILHRLIRLEALLTPAPRPPLYLTPELLELFLTWSRDVQHTSPKWLGDQRRYLTWWSERLQGVDLRRASLQLHLVPALDSQRGRAPRIAVIKRLYSWLRLERHTVEPAEDPTYAKLRCLQARPAQLRIVKVVDQADYRAVRKHLTPRWRDALDVLAGTGWHVTELQRFAIGGRIVRGNILICPRTKRGVPLRTRVSAPVLQAAREVMRRGALTEKRFRLALRRASAAAVVRTIKPGQLRHSVASYAIDVGGELPARVAAFLCHRSRKTLLDWYATHTTPRKVATLA